jgi:pimeloyl-ACP methyl ester carboxylesterase
LSNTEDRTGGDLREGYAEVGDVRLHYVEAGDGHLIVLLHGFPEFWYGWRLQIKPLVAAAFASSHLTCAATTCRRGRTASRPMTSTS